MTVEAPLLVTCGRCRRPFELSARRIRKWQRRRQQPLCAGCLETTRMVAWWREQSGLTADELAELAHALGKR